nr:hypothetical protein [Tanacetum cinerariifolium]GEY44270.1 hypothetical protein [Tanacetum cinerariifolium]
MAKLAFCDYHNMVAILEKTGHNTDFYQIVDFLKASHIRRSTRGTIWISQSKVLSPGTDETTFPSGDVRYEEAFPTDTSLDAGQDMENIAKTSAMPHEALPRVTSLGGGEGSMQQTLQELMDFYTSLQRQYSLLEEKVQNQDLEITQLKTRIKTLKDNDRIKEGLAQEDTSNTGGMDQGDDLLVGDTVKDSDKSTYKGSDSTDEMSHVLGSLGAANILASGGLSVATPTTRVTRSLRGVIIGSSSPISVNISSIIKKDKGKGKMTEPKQPNLIVREQAERDSVIARIHAERELEVMIAQLDRSNEMIAKYLSEYEQATVGLSRDEKSLVKKTCSTIEVIDEKAKELWVKLKRLYEPDSRDPLWALQRLSVPTVRLSVLTADVYIANKLVVVEDFALLHEDKIYSESKMRVCYI